MIHSFHISLRAKFVTFFSRNSFLDISPRISAVLLKAHITPRPVSFRNTEKRGLSAPLILITMPRREIIGKWESVAMKTDILSILNRRGSPVSIAYPQLHSIDYSTPILHFRNCFDCYCLACCDIGGGLSSIVVLMLLLFLTCMFSLNRKHVDSSHMRMPRRIRFWKLSEIGEIIRDPIGNCFTFLDTLRDC